MDLDAAMHKTCAVINVDLGFLHAFVPGFMVSIADMIGAIVVGVIAVIWALLFLISSIPGVFKAIG